MVYTLMNKNAELLDLEIDQGTILSVSRIREENVRLLPVFLTPQKHLEVSRAAVQAWWSGRRIPVSRSGVKELLWHLDNISLDYLAEKSMGLSLSDHFWIRPSPEITWEKINFFRNEFSEDIGKLLITGDWNGGSMVSPDNTSDGVIRKRWKIIDDVRCLVKGSNGAPWFAQPFREVFASKVAELLFGGEGFVVPYSLLRYSDVVFSVCPNFVTVDTEYVAMNQFIQAYKRPNHVSSYDFAKQFYGVHGYVLDLMLILDFIVLNEDRHFGNFGLLRDANTGELGLPAPIFDAGSSLFYKSTRISLQGISAKPFHSSFERQIKHVDVAGYRDAILQVKENISYLFWAVFRDAYEDEERLSEILRFVNVQVDKLL